MFLVSRERRTWKLKALEAKPASWAKVMVKEQAARDLQLMVQSYTGLLTSPSLNRLLK